MKFSATLLVFLIGGCGSAESTPSGSETSESTDTATTTSTSTGTTDGPITAKTTPATAKVAQAKSTATETVTSTETASNVETATSTETSTVSETETATETGTSTETATETGTSTETATETASSTETATATSTGTGTATISSLEIEYNVTGPQAYGSIQPGGAWDGYHLPANDAEIETIIEYSGGTWPCLGYFAWVGEPMIAAGGASVFKAASHQYGILSDFYATSGVTYCGIFIRY